MTDQPQQKGTAFGAWLVLGIGVRTALGAAFDNVALGIGLGVAIGLGIGSWARARKR